MIGITIHRGAGVNTVVISGETFDLNAITGKQYNLFRRDLLKGLAGVWKVSQ